MISRDDIDPLRREISEVFWSYLYRDRFQKAWIDAFIKCEGLQNPVDTSSASSYMKELISALEEVETAVDQVYFALLKYPADLQNHLSIVGPGTHHISQSHTNHVDKF